MKKKRIIIILSIIIVVALSTCLIFYFKNKNSKSSKNDVSSIDTNIKVDNGDEKIDWDSMKTTKVTLSKSLKITEEGVYILTGTISNGSITVNTDGNVKLVLNGVNITNNSGSAILVENAKNVVIETNEGTTNNLEDGSNYSDIEYDGCIYSKDDLVLQGSGTLNVTSNYSDAIVSTDDLKIVSGTYNIKSQDDGIRGKDSVYILGGTINIDSNADGIKSTNDSDSTKGFIYIKNGTIVINSVEDAIQAQTKLIIDDGNFDITTNGGSGQSGSAVDKSFGRQTTYDETSAKGLKAESNLVIKGGNFKINSKDDAVHSNNDVGISNATMEISSGDDGIHADSSVIIESGTINITKSYEGIEGKNITVNSGNISLVSSDDGFNVSGGNDSSSMNGRPGQNGGMDADSGGVLTINGGTIYVSADGDGLDSNGSITMTGGIVYVDGPTNNGNGALDYNATFNISGGSLIAVGSSGMAQSTSTSSSQISIQYYLSGNYSDKLSIEDSSGNVIFEYSPKKSYQNVVYSSGDLKEGETYTLKINGNSVGTVTASSIVNSNGSGNNYGMQRGGRR